MTMPTYDSRNISKSSEGGLRHTSKAIVSKLGDVAGSLNYIAGSLVDAGVWLAKQPSALVSYLQDLEQAAPEWKDVMATSKSTDIDTNTEE